MLVGGVWIYLMKEKSKASQLLKDLCHMASTQFESKGKVIQSDNGLEFTPKSMQRFCR